MSPDHTTLHLSPRQQAAYAEAREAMRTRTRSAGFWSYVDGHLRMARMWVRKVVPRD